MSTTDQLASKPKRPKVADLLAQLETRDKSIAELTAQVSELRQQIAAKADADKSTLEETKEDRATINRLLAVLEPIHKATKGWSWPNPSLAMIQKLTFGHVKAAVEAFENTSRR